MPGNDALAQSIRDKALSLGYIHCGMIPLGDLAGFDDKLAERLARFPESAPSFANYKRSLANIRTAHPWAKAVVVCVRRYGKYRIPPHLRGLIGVFYLTDSRRDARSAGHKSSTSFERHLAALGLRAAADRSYGLVPYRWAAAKAGLGIIRKNNFLYTEHGSWVDVEAWLTDAELELRETCALPACPENCRRCVESCPTRSLAEPYMTNRENCVSALTTWKGGDMTEPQRDETGRWLYGCDACQDACPFNRDKWTEDEEFPGLAELAESVSLEKIAALDYDRLRAVVAEKFWYIGENDGWKWKVDAINAMLISRDPRYLAAIQAARNDLEPRVRNAAEFALRRFGEP